MDEIPVLVDVLTPSILVRRRMARKVVDALEADKYTLYDEWIALLRVRPLVHGCYAIAAALLLMWLLPMGLLPLRLLAG
jgi:hypothetical protein